MYNAEYRPVFGWSYLRTIVRFSMITCQLTSGKLDLTLRLGPTYSNYVISIRVYC